MWPALIEELLRRQAGSTRQWGIAQKQTGADRLTLGGALAANVHGRGLKMKPFIGDVESFVLIDATGRRRTCSRRENADLFKLAIGGYGLFGAVATVKLRLIPRQKIQRVVEVRTIDELPAAFDQRIADGFIFGDFQFAIDETSDDFLRRGVFSCYKPVDAATPMPEGQKELVDDDWQRLLLAAHAEQGGGVPPVFAGTTCRPTARSTGPTRISSARIWTITTRGSTRRSARRIRRPR